MQAQTRRRFIFGALAAPVAFVGLKAAGTVRKGIAALRPSARGTTVTTCAQCGEQGHSMLDPNCPASPRVV